MLQERKNLAFTLKDTKSVVAHVEMMLGVFLHTLFAFAYLYIFEVCSSPIYCFIQAGESIPNAGYRLYTICFKAIPYCPHA